MARLTDQEVDMATQLSNRMARKIAGTHATCKVIYIDGDTTPKLTGESCHYENSRGDYIRYPNAYRRAFGRPIYRCSTLRVIVGRKWLAAQPWTALRPT